MHPKFLDCRLVHLEYDKDLQGEEKRKQQIKAKQELLANLMISFNLSGGEIVSNTILTKDQKWYFSTTHIPGSTMVFIAKWPVGIDCICKSQVPENWQELASLHMSATEKEFVKDEQSFMQVWASKEAFFKCLYNATGFAPDFDVWKMEPNGVNYIYKLGDSIYECNKGTSPKDQVIVVCNKRV